MSNVAVTKFEEINKLKPREIFDMAQISNIFEKSYGKDFKHILEREKVFALQLITESEDLRSCEPFSIYTAIVNLSVCKLTLNPAMKQAALVKYRVNVGTSTNKEYVNKAKLNIMYQGKIDILTGIGAMKYVKACELVYDCDDFQMDMGVVKKHIPDLAKITNSKIIGGYIIAVMPDGKEKHLFMREDQFLKRKEKAPSKAFWDNWGEEMRKKTLVNKIYDTLPKTASFPAIASAFKETEEFEETQHEVVLGHKAVIQEGVNVEDAAEPGNIDLSGATKLGGDVKEEQPSFIPEEPDPAAAAKVDASLQEQADEDLPF